MKPLRTEYAELDDRRPDADIDGVSFKRPLSSGIRAPSGGTRSEVGRLSRPGAAKKKKQQLGNKIKHD